MTVGKLINFFISKTSPVTNDEAPVEEIVNVETEPVELKASEEEAAAPPGWESETIHEPLLSSTTSNVTAKAIKRQLRRKCISVGPVLLSSELQIIRKQNFEDREERYRYDIVPVDSTTQEHIETADDKCGFV